MAELPKAGLARRNSEELELLRKRAENLLDEGGFMSDALNAVEAYKVFHELQIHQLELEMQNDELSDIATDLELQKDKFSSLFELAPVGYVILNYKGIIQDINHTGCRLFGLRKELLLGKALPAFVFADDIGVFYSFFRRVLSGATEHNCQVRMFKLHQATFYAELNGVCAGKGSPSNTYITISDITEKKQAELELTLAKQELDVALTASSTGIWEIEVTSGKIFLDEFSHSIFGLTPGSFDGKYTSLMALIDDADKEAVDTALRVVMVRGSDLNIEFEIHTHGGKQKYINARGKITYDAEVNRRFTGTVTDITEKKCLELETRALKESQQHEIRAAALQAEENARRSISESLHDSVGQILYAMRINLEQIKGLSSDPNYKQVSQLLTQAINDVRNLSFELAPSILRDFGLKATVEEMARRFSTQNLSIKVTGPEIGGLEMTVMVNIYRIIQELVNNCIKHAEASQVSIDLLKRKNFIYIQVKDNGKGFVPGKRSRNGSGTGLSSIRNRLNLYSGTMDIESAAGKGTNVLIRLKQ